MGTTMRGIVLMMLLAAAPASAVPPGPPPGPPGAPHHMPPGEDDGPGNAAFRAAIEAKVKAVRAKLLRTEVGLDDATARKVEARMDQGHARRRALQRQERRAGRALGLLLEADSDDMAALQRAVDGVLAARQQLAAEREQEFGALRALVTPKQAARLLLGMRGMHHELRRMIEAERRAALERRARALLEGGERAAD